MWWYQSQGHLPRSRSNTKVTLFKKKKKKKKKKNRLFSGALVFHKHSLFCRNVFKRIPARVVETKDFVNLNTKFRCVSATLSAYTLYRHLG